MKKRVFSLALVLALLLAAAANAAMEDFAADRVCPDFADVAGNTWYTSDVKAACELGLMEGRGNGLFGPGDGLTLAEAVTMAARAHSVYEGGGFTPGGKPWYQNAVDYAVAHGIVGADEYRDYTKKASRADMAGLFAYCLPMGEYRRINRVGTVPDVGAFTPYADALLQLCGAGVLTGDAGTGAFRPHDGVTRAEAAAIIARVALPGARRSVALPWTAQGQEAGLADGSLRLDIPAGWVVTREGDSGFSAVGGTVSISVQRHKRAGYAGLGDFASRLPASVLAAGADAVLTEPVFPSRFHGLNAYCFRYEQGAGGGWRGALVYLVENSGAYYVLTLVNGPECTQEEWTAALSALYTLDLAL